MLRSRALSAALTFTVASSARLITPIPMHNIATNRGTWSQSLLGFPFLGLLSPITFVRPEEQRKRTQEEQEGGQERERSKSYV